MKSITILNHTFESQADAAKYFGLSCAYISLVATGQREVTSGMARKLGYKKYIYPGPPRQVEFVKIERKDRCAFAGLCLL